MLGMADVTPTAGAARGAVGHHGVDMSTEHAPAHDGHVHTDQEVEGRIAATLERLRRDGGRITTARRAVVRTLYAGDDHHVTAEDVAAAVQADHPDVHLSTVYRTLEALEGLDVVARVDLGAGPAVFHLVDHIHHHLVCERCGTVTEATADVVDALAQVLDQRFGFAAAPHRLTITGLCRGCR